MTRRCSVGNVPWSEGSPQSSFYRPAAGDIDQVIVRDADTMHRIELLRTGAFVEAGAWGAIVGLIPVSSPHTLEGSRIGIEDDHAPIAITIRNEDLIGFGIDDNTGRPIQVFGVAAATSLSFMADLQQEFSGFRELQDVGVFARGIS